MSNVGRNETESDKTRQNRSFYYMADLYNHFATRQFHNSVFMPVLSDNPLLELFFFYCPLYPKAFKIQAFRLLRAGKFV